MKTDLQYRSGHSFATLLRQPAEIESAAAAACGFFLVIGCGQAGAATPEQQMADRIAKFVQGRLVIEGLAIYRAAMVTARIEGGELSLRIDADPLYELEQRAIRFDSGGGTTLYEDFLPSEAKCGLPEFRNRIDGTHISVKALLSEKPPEFPSYTRKDLRQAIRAHFGQEGLASVEEAKPCEPFLRGHRFIVKYGPRVVQEISIYYPGGC